jgi:hypothetical protein
VNEQAKATKAESGGGATSQPPRGAEHIAAQQRLGEAQRLTTETEKYANLPKQAGGGS